MKNISFKIQLLFSCIIFWGLIQITSETKAQDNHFSQFYLSPLTLNPALTGGFDGSMRAFVNYKDQWRNISTPYKTFAFSYDMCLKKPSSTGALGIGLSVLSDKAGESQLGLNQINLSLAYHVQISSFNTLSAGIQGGFGQQSMNFEEVKWGNQYNGTNYDSSLPSLEPTHTNSKSYPDFAAGLQWSFSKGPMYATANNQMNVNAGISFFHVTQPNTSFYSSSVDKLPLKMVFHASSLIGFKNAKSSIAPSLAIVQQGKLKNIIVGTAFRYQLMDPSKYTGNIKGAAASLGMYYRVGDAIIPSVTLEIAQYQIGISYDVNTSGLSKASLGKGGIEVSLRFMNPNPFTSSSTVSSKTPRLFN
ncbi:MAG: PorP/SprF family type IX secretion system membrane protein [Bacteroidetes bacterium]|nr:PorP/SprF family type IX secretion system membrane protein [Bacteroidota bacterium]